MASERMRRQKVGIALALVLLVGYFTICIGIEFGMGVQRGYGTGFSNNGYVPASVAEPAGFEAGVDPMVIAKATNNYITPSETTIWNETWRLGASLLAMLGLTYFFSAMMSRLGSY